jgi:hypothetical protein
MKTLDIFWHVYRRNQIKPGLCGDLVYFLDIPSLPGVPVIRRVIELRGTGFPQKARFPRSPSLNGTHHGILFEGVNQAAADQLMLAGPKIHKADPRFAFYNRDVICNAREFFLINPESGFEGMSEQTVRLLQGQNVVLERPLFLASAFKRDQAIGDGKFGEAGD